MGKIADAIRSISLPQQDKKKLLTLDEEFVNMETKIQTLQSDNLHLQAKVNPLEREIQGLKDQIEKSAAQDHDRLEEMEEKILVTLSQARSRLTVDVIAGPLQINRMRAEHFLKRLMDENFIVAAYSYVNPTKYSLDHRGNEYLVTNNLV